MRRVLLTAILLMAFLLAACSDDLPTDTRGCKANPVNPEGRVYGADAGCLYGNILEAHEGEAAESEEHGEETKAEESEEATPEAEPEAEATEAATAEPSD